MGDVALNGQTMYPTEGPVMLPNVLKDATMGHVLPLICASALMDGLARRALPLCARLPVQHMAPVQDLINALAVLVGREQFAMLLLVRLVASMVPAQLRLPATAIQAGTALTAIKQMLALVVCTESPASRGIVSVSRSTLAISARQRPLLQHTLRRTWCLI